MSPSRHSAEDRRPPPRPHDPERAFDPPPLVDMDPLPPSRRRTARLPRRIRRPVRRYGIAVGVSLAVLLAFAGLAAHASRMSTVRQRQQASTAGAAGGGAMDTSTQPSTGTASSPAASTTMTVATVYEAEDTAHNTLGPATKIFALPGVSGGKVVGNLGHGTPAGDLRFNDVTAQAAGAYTVAIYYLLPDTVARRLALWVDGKGPVILNFPPLGAGATTKVAVLRSTVTLTAGTNTIRFSNATAKYGPELDRIAVTRQ
ncbi:MAG TPA: hypothetical protein VJT31_05060 [Rugosimonospora sp.]|nr:hypothetical protein [Rugosimonospora sp.]